MKNVFIFLVILLVIGLLVVFVSLKPRDSSHSAVSPTPALKNIADINRDGIVDSVDKNFILNTIGCKKSESCWNKVVGKTSDGDNPIYTSDLDLNRDGAIDQSDLDLVK